LKVKHRTLLLSQSEVSRCIDIPEVVQVVEEVYRAHGRGEVAMPAKITLDMGQSGEPNWMNAMPAYIPHLHAAGIKWAGGFINNPQRGLSYVMASIVLNDPVTGLPDAVLDGTWITNARTGAAAAVGANYLSRRGPKQVAFVGAGQQARYALRAMRGYLEVAAVRAADPSPEARRSFQDEMQRDTGLPLSVTDNIEEAVRGADVIVTVTPADGPLVHLDWIQPGTFIASMGSFQELEESVVLQATKIVVDSWEQCAHRGELKKLVDAGRVNHANIYAEIGAILEGQRTGWEPADRHIVGVLIGLGSLDIAVARRVVDRARERGLGTVFEFSA
jgi:alanine dehydrogenase